MLKVLFQSIPSILFEPIAVGAVLGLVTAAVLGWRKKTAWYWSVAFALLFMISWRVIIQIISSRYASILVFPATIATAYFAFKLDWLAGFIPKFPEWLRKSLPYLTVIGIAIGGMAQLLHYNPYADRILKISELIKADAKQYKNTCILTSEARRLRYYTGLPVKSISGDKINDDHFMKQIMLKNVTEDAVEAVYVVFPVHAARSAESYLREIPDYIRKELVLLGEFYHNRKKRRLTRVYRLDRKNIIKKMMRPYQKELPSPKVYHRVTFSREMAATSYAYKEFMKHFENRKNIPAPKFKKFPYGWTPLWCPGYGKNCNGEFDLVTLPAGERAFKIKSDSLIAVHYTRMLPAEVRKIRVKFSGQPGSHFSLAAHIYDKKERWRAYKSYMKVLIPQEGVWIFSADWSEFLQEDEKLRLAVHLYHGEIFIHSIELYEVGEEK